MAHDASTTPTTDVDPAPSRKTALTAVVVAGEDVGLELIGVEVDEEVIALSFPDGRRVTFDPLELRAAISL